MWPRKPSVSSEPPGHPPASGLQHLPGRLVCPPPLLEPPPQHPLPARPLRPFSPGSAPSILGAASGLLPLNTAPGLMIPRGTPSGPASHSANPDLAESGVPGTLDPNRLLTAPPAGPPQRAFSATSSGRRPRSHPDICALSVTPFAPQLSSLPPTSNLNKHSSPSSSPGRPSLPLLNQVSEQAGTRP